MKRSPLFATAVLFLAAAVPAARARLGETRQECLARYGEPVAEVPALLELASGVAFQKDGIRIRVEFLGDRAAFISFSGRTMKENDRDMLLTVNGGPLVWNPSADFLGRLFWTAPGAGTDAARHASSYLMGGSRYLDLATDEWARAMKTQQAVQFALHARPKPAAPAAPGSGGSGAAGSGPARTAPSSQLKGF